MPNIPFLSKDHARVLAECLAANMASEPNPHGPIIGYTETGYPLRRWAAPTEESLAVTCPHCGHTSDVRIPARFKP